MMDKADAMVRVVRMLPRSQFTNAVGWLSERTLPRAARPFVLGACARAFGMDLSEAERPIEDYPSFLDLFCRGLAPGLRPCADEPDLLVSPVDGRLVDVGPIHDDLRFEIKGQTYSVLELLGGDRAWADRFASGDYLLFYLAPKDYHRMHSPAAARVLEYRWVRGELWPVAEGLVSRLAKVYSDNERIITYLGTDHGVMAMVKVAALGVGNVTLAYLGEAPGERHLARRRLPAVSFASNGRAPMRLERAEEMASFGLGSTVVLLLEPGRLVRDEGLRWPRTVRVGERVAGLRARPENMEQER